MIHYGSSEHSTGSVGYRYEVNNTEFCPFDWNITLADKLKLHKPAISQGIYRLDTNYTFYKPRNYDVSFYKNDCKTLATPTFPLIFEVEENVNDITSTGNESDSINNVQLFFTYNQTMIQESNIWTGNKTGGYADFCIRVENYLPEPTNPWALGIHFHEARYTIGVDSLTDFNTTVDVVSKDPLQSVDAINYEEEIVGYPCNDDYSLKVGAKYTQGSFVNICVETTESSAFGVHSIKDIVLSQIDPFIPFDPPTYESYQYVKNYVDSNLAYSSCIGSNTTDAICKAKMQLVGNFFDGTNIDLSAGIITVTGTVKLDYVGRRFLMDVPIQVRLDHSPSIDTTSRSLQESDESGTFKVRIGIQSEEVDDSSDSSHSFTIILSTAISLVAGCFMYSSIFSSRE